jgi:hypothetical protein
MMAPPASSETIVGYSWCRAAVEMATPFGVHSIAPPEAMRCA